MDIRGWIANEVRSAELAIIISNPTLIEYPIRERVQRYPLFWYILINKYPTLATDTEVNSC